MWFDDAQQRLLITEAMRRTFAHHSRKPYHQPPISWRESFGAFALNQLSLSKSRLVSKNHGDWEIAAIKPRGKLQPWSNVASVFLRIWSAPPGILLPSFTKPLTLSPRQIS